MRKKITEIDDKKEFHLFTKGHDGPTINVWTLLVTIFVIFLISGVSVTVRDWVFISADIAQTWYDGVDSILDALGAPKLP